MRLDRFLREKFSLRSRTYAEDLIVKGMVEVDGKCVVKPAYDVDDKNFVKILSDDDYASRGAYKLKRALEAFSLSVEDAECADIGCSNGGFTDLLLRGGAKSVFAVDVGECALPKRLASDPRVTFRRINARDLPASKDKDFLCADLSFISLKLVLPAFFGQLKEGGRCVVLVKPQFEAGRGALSKKGLVLSEKDRERAVREVRTAAESAGFRFEGLVAAPEITDKNREYLMYLLRP